MVEIEVDILDSKVVFDTGTLAVEGDNLRGWKSIGRQIGSKHLVLPAIDEYARSSTLRLVIVESGHHESGAFACKAHRSEFGGEADRARQRICDALPQRLVERLAYLVSFQWLVFRQPSNEMDG